ncbi:Ig domain-containing protein [Legionella fairfieldensis]|uniref:Ig domain-containing protein n=1 Tax=Legionella fairfieldensis TaxID=45064 RepID=UPI000491B975|nr:Ig domain-containing protein [Legionella fairfieldensis]
MNQLISPILCINNQVNSLSLSHKNLPKNEVRVILGFLLVLLSFTGYAGASLSLNPLTPYTGHVFYGEEFRIRMYIPHHSLKGWQSWILPAGVRLEAESGLCAYLFLPALDVYDGGICYLHIVIPGSRLGQIINGMIYYRLIGWGRKPVDILRAQPFSVNVIPHPLSMASIPQQSATANQPFYLDLRPYVNYYLENVQALTYPAIGVTPVTANGLYYDATKFAIVGTPSQSGTYRFSVNAHNNYGTAAAVPLVINVRINPAETPGLKQAFIATGAPGEVYSLNLNEFLASSQNLASNPIRFRIDTNKTHPDWLKVEETRLTGTIPFSEAGQSVEVTLIASSNAGGDSAPLTIHIPIAVDPAKRPGFEPHISLDSVAGGQIVNDLRQSIVDPANASDLTLIIENVEPAAPWLSISSVNPTELIGTVPEDATGQIYYISLHAWTSIGGSSDTIKIPLKIAIDSKFTPYFTIPEPKLSIAYMGQPYFYDFVANREVSPEYEEIPYVIELAENYQNPSWLRIENNRLIADLIPQIDTSEQLVYVTLRNIPGGPSKVFPLKLYVM